MRGEVHIPPSVSESLRTAGEEQGVGAVFCSLFVGLNAGAGKEAGSGMRPLRKERAALEYWDTWET